MIHENPLLEPFETAPFFKIKTEHFNPAIEEAIKMAKMEIEKITCFRGSPRLLKIRLKPWNLPGNKLDRITSIFFNLNSAETNDEIQKLAQEISPVLTDFKNDIIQDPELFQKGKSGL